MKIRVEESSLALALVRAAGTLGVTQDQLAYTLIQEKMRLFGLLGRRVTIEAWRRSGAGDPGSRRAPSSPATAEQLQGWCTLFANYGQALIDKMFGPGLPVSARVEDGRILVDIASDHLASTLAQSPKIAEAIEHILRKQVRRHDENLACTLFVDAHGVRVNRQAELEKLARELSEQVVATQKPVVLNYRSAFDRKTIHMALDSDDRVVTRSMGTGAHRKLMILPAATKTSEGQRA